MSYSWEDTNPGSPPGSGDAHVTITARKWRGGTAQINFVGELYFDSYGTGASEIVPSLVAMRDALLKLDFSSVEVTATSENEYTLVEDED